MLPKLQGVITVAKFCHLLSNALLALTGALISLDRSSCSDDVMIIIDLASLLTFTQSIDANDIKRVILSPLKWDQCNMDMLIDMLVDAD